MIKVIDSGIDEVVECFNRKVECFDGKDRVCLDVLKLRSRVLVVQLKVQKIGVKERKEAEAGV